MAIANAGDKVQKRQQCAFAKVMGNVFLGDTPSARQVNIEQNDLALTSPSALAGSGFSQAAAWAAEPEWNGEASEETAEILGGMREPEE